MNDSAAIMCVSPREEWMEWIESLPETDQCPNTFLYEPGDERRCVLPAGHPGNFHTWDVSRAR